MKVRQPRSTEAATALCDRYATQAGHADAIGTIRNDAIAAANATADKELVPIREEMAGIEAALQPWWAKNGEKLTVGKRKSIELGGCTIGTRVGAASLEYTGNHEDPVEALQGKAWAKPFVVVRFSIDKAAIRKELTGKHGEKLKGLGFREKAGAESFVLKRAEQDGTIG